VANLLEGITTRFRPGRKKRLDGGEVCLEEYSGTIIVQQGSDGHVLVKPDDRSGGCGWQGRYLDGSYGYISVMQANEA
jgi:hypothetical protein